MQETKTLKLLLNSGTTLKIDFTDNKHSQESEKVFDEVETAKLENRPVFLGMLDIKEVVLQGRKIAPMQFFDHKKIIAWSVN